LKKTITVILAAFLLVTGITCEAQSKQYYQYSINADGTISTIHAPDNVIIPIEQKGDYYVLLDDIGSLAIARSNIVLDGNGYGLPGSVTYTDSYAPSGIVTSGGGSISGNHVENVTIKNVIIQNTNMGIILTSCTNCTIENNTIIKATVLFIGMEASGAIFINEGASNKIVRNQIIDSDYGVVIGDSSNNQAYLNNFCNNKHQAWAINNEMNFWDNGSAGNFWSDYREIDGNGDGIGDSPYTIDSHNVDHYPLMTAYIAIESTETPTTIVSPTASPIAESSSVFIVAASVAAVAVILASLGLAVFLRKRRH
jgi:parallel beta-helix repeat protein